MTEQAYKSLGELMEFSKKLPQPPTLDDIKNKPVCPACRKHTPLDEITYVSGGIVAAKDVMCGECKPTFHGWAYLICPVCCRVAFRIKPQTCKYTGFQIKSNGIYHVDGCINCASELQNNNVRSVSVKIIEYDLWCKQVGWKP